jgi:hypothetical protein
MDHSYYFRRRSSITDGRATSFGAGTLCFVQPQRPLVAVALWLPYILEVSTLPSALQMRGNALLNALERSERGMVEVIQVSLAGSGATTLVSENNAKQRLVQRWCEQQTCWPLLMRCGLNGHALTVDGDWTADGSWESLQRRHR